MIKGVPTNATNSTAIGTGGTCPSLLTVPTGKTFILTDLVIAPSYGADTASIATVLSAGIVSFYDVSAGGSTAASGTTVAKFKVNYEMQTQSGGGSAIAYAKMPAVYHFTNGPEFSNGVTIELTDTGSENIGTGCVWISGLLR